MVTISSKYKQKYECRLPAAAVKIHQEKDEDPQSYTGLGVSELLKPMEAAPCLIKVTWGQVSRGPRDNQTKWVPHLPSWGLS